MGARVARKAILLLAAVLIGSGCIPYTVPRYGVSADHVRALKEFDQKVSVGRFTATTPGQSKIRCKASGPVETPDGEPFEEYIRRALVDELDLADMISDASPVALSGNLDHIDFDSGRGNWKMELTIRSTNGRSLTVASQYDFGTGPIFASNSTAAAERACVETAQAFSPAVQRLIGTLFIHPDFPGLLQ